MLANVNGWTEVEKATYLAVSLKGSSALTVLSNLLPDNLYNYSSLVTALDAHFGSSHQTELHRMKLKSRYRKREEGLAELAKDIERLARLAYPTAPSTMLELLAKDQFIDVLQDGDVAMSETGPSQESMQGTTGSCGIGGLSASKPTPSQTGERCCVGG